ncbi:BTB domain-containing protein [Mycena kentingensis (nom. inval.)]|nr:BTB domain-containing protein [Mycena kentingensis (nom. inval.)]
MLVDQRLRAKRKHDDSGATESTRSNIWMPYGDLILEVESTRFRVNKDLLAKHSAVFATMFALPLPPDEPMVEGCPVVKLHDSPKDWELFLDMLYDPFTLAHAAAPWSIALVGSTLRLGSKYDMPAAKQSALSRLEPCFPTTLAGHDKPKPAMMVLWQPGLCAELLQILCESGFQRMVPAAAFYCLCENTLESLLGNTILGKDGRPLQLPTSLKIMLAVGAERMNQHQLQSTVWLRDTSVIPHAHCTSSPICTRGRLRILDVLMAEMLARRWVLFSGLPVALVLCQHCDFAARAKFTQNRRQAWNALPGFFELATWDELHDWD